ncbi:MAG: hypothetical protein ABSB69_09820 [Solirubrobacteraceae bacterium]
MPCASTSTVAPSDAFDADFTALALLLLLVEAAGAALAGALVLAAALVAGGDVELELFELLPHAASVSDTASAGIRVFRVGRIGTPLAIRQRVKPTARLWVGQPPETPPARDSFRRS